MANRSLAKSYGGVIMVVYIALLDRNHDELDYFEGYERVEATFSVEQMQDGAYNLVSDHNIIFRFDYLAPYQTARVDRIGIVDSNGNPLYAIKVGDSYRDGYHMSRADTLQFNRGSLVICYH